MFTRSVALTGVVASALFLPAVARAASVELVSAFRRVEARANVWSGFFPDEISHTDSDSDVITQESAEPGGSPFGSWSATASAVASVPAAAGGDATQVVTVHQTSNTTANRMEHGGFLRSIDSAPDRELGGHGWNDFFVTFRLDAPHVYEFESATGRPPEGQVVQISLPAIWQTDEDDQVINHHDLFATAGADAGRRTLAAGLWQMRLGYAFQPPPGEDLDVNFNYAVSLTPAAMAIPLPAGLWGAIATMGVWGMKNQLRRSK